MFVAGIFNFYYNFQSFNLSWSIAKITSLTLTIYLNDQQPINYFCFKVMERYRWGEIIHL